MMSTLIVKNLPDTEWLLLPPHSQNPNYAPPLSSS